MEVEKVLQAALAAIEAAGSESSLEEVRVRYLGRKGELTKLLKSLGQLPRERRPSVGAAINAAKDELQSKIEARRTALASEQLAKKMATEAVGRDPARPPPR